MNVLPETATKGASHKGASRRCWPLYALVAAALAAPALVGVVAARKFFVVEG
jgi:hypothetical protein